MKPFTFFLTVCLFTSVCSWSQIVNKVDIRLNLKGTDTEQKIVIVLNDQADVSSANFMKGKDIKANFVYATLYQKAEETQINIRKILTEKAIPFRSYYIVNMVSLSANRRLIEELSRLPEVREILEDSNFKMEERPEGDRNSSGSRAIEWNVSHIGAPSVWAMGYQGQTAVIGGQDTGYEWNDPCLINKYRGWDGTTANHNYNWHDAIYANNPVHTNNNPCGYNLSAPCDDDNHGTHTMGTMVGDDGGSNQIGVAPGAKWIGCRNMERGWGTLTTYTECFEWFLAPYPYGSTPANGDPSKMPHVINNSWGCPTSEGCNTTNFAVMEQALNNLRTAGCVVVVSAGNSGSACATVSDPPAFFNGSLSVGATNNTDAIASFSSRGPVTVDDSGRLKPNVCAPGVNVRSCITGNNNYASWPGTSMAGPHVAGLVALIISANPYLAGEVDIIEDIIEQTSIHLTSTQNCGSVPGTNIPNSTFGFGRISAPAAVNTCLPTNFAPFVKQSNVIVINNADFGIILTDTNGAKYRLRVNNAGKLTVSTGAGLSSGSIKIVNASLFFESNDANIIMKSPDNTYWSMAVENNSNLTITPVTNIPSSNFTLQNGDVQIENTNKGIIMKSPDGSCHVMNISDLGKILMIPITCPI